MWREKEEEKNRHLGRRTEFLRGCAPTGGGGGVEGSERERR